MTASIASCGGKWHQYCREYHRCTVCHMSEMEMIDEAIIAALYTATQPLRVFASPLARVKFEAWSGQAEDLPETPLSERGFGV